MALKAVLDTLDNTPENERPFYKEVGGKFVLDAEVPQDDIQKMRGVMEYERQQRAKAIKERYALKADMAALTAQLDKKLKGTPSPPNANADEEFKRQFAAQAKAYEAQFEQIKKLLSDEKAIREQTEQKLAETKIVDGLRQAAIDAGVIETGIPDAINRVRPMWQYDRETGNAVPRQGETPIYSEKEPMNPMSMKESIERMLKEAPHLKRTTSGSGAAGSGSTRAGGAIVLTREQAKDPRMYAEAKAQSEKTGAQIEIATP